MALKFLNKKGWHTGSLRNIENVWKAEQKHDAEQKKLDELRKQIQDERERDEFRVLQEKAGILPRQERLEFLYDSGLAVGKGSNDGVVFKSLDSTAKESAAAPASSSAASASAASNSAVPGALFEEKTYSANDAWRKLHSDPLLMIRQREQEALARIKNNPVQMAMIRKSVAEKSKDKERDKKEHKEKHRHRSSKHKKHPLSSPADSDDSSEEERYRRKKNVHEGSKHKKRSPSPSPALSDEERYKRKKNFHESTKSHYRYREEQSHYDASRQERKNKSFNEDSRQKPEVGARPESHYRHGKPAHKLTEEERAARLREMQLDAEVHEEQRWKRLKKAAEDDAREATRDAISRGKNFLDATHKSVYGAENGGTSTIEESVRRRTHYSQGSRGGEGNAFRRQ